MNLRTFYRLFYKHRIKKASIFLKLYIIIIVPLKYLVNIFYFEKKVDLDKHKMFHFKKKYGGTLLSFFKKASL